MMKSKIHHLPALLAALLLACPGAAARDPARKESLFVQKVRPGRLNGLVQDADGTRLEEVPIEILNANGKVVGKGATNKYGLYSIKNLPEGRYLLRVAGRNVVILEATPKATVSSLKIILPPGGGGLTPLQWTLIAAGGVAVAVGVAAIVHGHGGSSHHTVSP